MYGDGPPLSSAQRKQCGFGCDQSKLAIRSMEDGHWGWDSDRRMKGQNAAQDPLKVLTKAQCDDGINGGTGNGGRFA